MVKNLAVLTNAMDVCGMFKGEKMRELIYRDDCDLNAPSLGRDEMIWDLIYEMHMPDTEEMFNFAVAVMDRAQAVIDTAPTVKEEK